MKLYDVPRNSRIKVIIEDKVPVGASSNYRRRRA